MKKEMHFQSVIFQSGQCFNYQMYPAKKDGVKRLIHLSLSLSSFSHGYDDVVDVLNVYRCNASECWTDPPVFGLLVMSALGFKAMVVPHLCTSSLACNGFLRFTSGVTSAELLTVNIAAKPFGSMYLYTYISIGRARTQDQVYTLTV